MIKSIVWGNDGYAEVGEKFFSLLRFGSDEKGNIKGKIVRKIDNIVIKGNLNMSSLDIGEIVIDTGRYMIYFEDDSKLLIYNVLEVYEE